MPKQSLHSTMTVTVHEQGFRLAGRLVYDNVSKVLAQGNDLIQQHAGHSIHIDCEQLARIDSAGIAALLDWQRTSEAVQKQCLFDKLPPQALSLLDAYQLQNVID